ncbi:hypothetical protein ABZ619_23840 [Streptomyces sp. NPDC007851]|uniref:hypothetical protein n=1 Tax=Streptomyces sp. NPDC007851 TaxID=3155008 RepID=UPI0033D7219E
MARSAGIDERTRQLVRARQIDSPELSPADRELVEVLQVVRYYWSFGRTSTLLEVEVTQVYGTESVLAPSADGASG